MARTRLTPEFSALLRCLKEHHARYLLIGGWAVGFHGFPRMTKDMDLWVGTHPDNARRVSQALWDWGEFEVDTSLLTKPGQLIRLGFEPVLVDLLTTLECLDFDEAYSRRTIVHEGGVAVSVIGFDDLRTGKLSTGDAMDAADVDRLDRVRAKKDPRINRGPDNA